MPTLNWIVKDKVVNHHLDIRWNTNKDFGLLRTDKWTNCLT